MQEVVVSPVGPGLGWSEGPPSGSRVGVEWRSPQWVQGWGGVKVPPVGPGLGWSGGPPSGSRVGVEWRSPQWVQTLAAGAAGFSSGSRVGVEWRSPPSTHAHCASAPSPSSPPSLAVALTDQPRSGHLPAPLPGFRGQGRTVRGGLIQTARPRVGGEFAPVARRRHVVALQLRGEGGERERERERGAESERGSE